jgi:uncharacterized protein
MAKRPAVTTPEPAPKLDPGMAKTRAEPPVGVRVGPTAKKGRGVFATRAFAKDELVEAAPVIVMPACDQNLVHETLLNDYVYEWRDSIAVALGYGSLYNHSWDPNLEYRKRHAEALIEYVAIRDIAEGDELTINYSSSRPDRGDLWTDLH